MNTDIAADVPGTDPAAYYGARVIAIIGLLIGLAEGGFAVLIAADAAHQTGDAAMFAGLGYILAAIIGVPGGFAVVLAAASLAVRRNLTAAYVTASASAVAVIGPVLLFLGLRS